MPYRVAFSPEAADQLTDLYQYIAKAASPDIALRYTSAIVDYCEGLGRFPHRGMKRDDVRPALRVTNYRKRAVIAFDVDDAARLVSVLSIFYGGQDYETAMHSSPNE